jgi:hypothetical protein
MEFAIKSELLICVISADRRCVKLLAKGEAEVMVSSVTFDIRFVFLTNI